MYIYPRNADVKTQIKEQEIVLSPFYGQEPSYGIIKEESSGGVLIWTNTDHIIYGDSLLCLFV